MQIDQQQAAVLVAALDKAIATVEGYQKRKGAQVAPYVGALKIELSAYKAVRTLVETSFPSLGR